MIDTSLQCTMRWLVGWLGCLVGWLVCHTWQYRPNWAARGMALGGAVLSMLLDASRHNHLWEACCTYSTHTRWYNIKLILSLCSHEIVRTKALNSMTCVNWSEKFQTTRTTLSMSIGVCQRLLSPLLCPSMIEDRTCDSQRNNNQ